MKNPKQILLIGIPVILIIAIVTTMVMMGKKTPVKKIVVIPTPTKALNHPSTTFKKYSDPAGFQIQYPDDLTLTPETATDEATYARITITSPSTKGKIEITVAETKAKTLAGLLKNKGVVRDTGPAPEMKDLKIAGMDAKEISVGNELIVYAVDQGVEFEIYTYTDTDMTYWQEAHNQILSSFTFAQPEEKKSAAPAAESSGGGESGGDEVIE